MDFWTFARNDNDSSYEGGGVRGEGGNNVHDVKNGANKYRARYKALVSNDKVQKFIQEADCACYQHIVDFLLPKVKTSHSTFHTK